MGRSGRGRGRWGGRGCAKHGELADAGRGEHNPHRYAHHFHRAAAMRILLFFVPVCLLAQSGLQPPGLGVMLDPNGFLRPVSGAAGSFVVGEARAGRLLSFSCSQSTCVAKTRDSILASAACIPAPSGPAVIAAGDSETTLSFQQSAQFAQLRNGALQTLDWIVDGEVLSMVSMPSGIKFAVKRETGVWITALDGSNPRLPPSGRSGFAAAGCGRICDGE